MTKQLLYYERAVPVSAQRHRNWSLGARSDYEFANHSNSVPLAAAEFSTAAMEYAIVFTQSEEAVQPAVVLGLKPEENLYLNGEGRWDAKYIPAYVRRYPFVFSKNDEDKGFTLCLDEHYSGWNQGGRGEALFDVNGEGTDFLNSMFRFVTGYQRQFDTTLAFCRKLEALDLLEPMIARFKLPSGKMAQLSGFLGVDRDKLKGLSGDRLSELSRSGELELIYLHLQSMRNFPALVAHVAKDAAGDLFAKELVELKPEGLWH